MLRVAWVTRPIRCYAGDVACRTIHPPRASTAMLRRATGAQGRLVRKVVMAGFGREDGDDVSGCEVEMVDAVPASPARSVTR